MKLILKKRCNYLCIAILVAILLIILSLIGILILFHNIPLHLTAQTSPEFWVAFFGSTIAIANAILLYITLRSQNEGIANEKENRKQEQFEISFFNLLEFHRKLTNEISITYTYLNSDAKLSTTTINGRKFFLFAVNELESISNTLQSDHITKYEEQEITKAIEAFEDKWSNIEQVESNASKKQKEWDSLYHIITIEYYNMLYNIDEKDHLNLPDNKNLPYVLLKNRWYINFEHYIRGLYYILDYLYMEKSDDKESMQKYIKFLQSQISRSEMRLIEIHAQVHTPFKKILDKTAFTTVLL